METKTAPPSPSAPNSAGNHLHPKAISADSVLASHGSAKHEFAKFGSLPPKPGSKPRGRPRLDGLPSGCNVPPPSAGKSPLVNPVENAATGDGLPRPPIDPVLLRKTVEGLVSGVDMLAVATIRGKASKVLPDGEAKLVAESVRCPAASKEIIATSLPIVLEKHGVGSDSLPEIALAAGLTGWVAGFAAALNRLNELIAEKEGKSSTNAAPV